MTDNIIVIILSYLIGCLSGAWLVTKYFFGKDIRSEGSGNVGAMNTYDVTGSKFSGFLVFLIDFLKGVLAIILVSQIYESDFYLIRLAAVFVVIGHNYNAFLSFKGGRGLSTAAGVFVMINPISAITWIIMYFTTKKIIRDNVHVGILGGCIGSSVLVLGFPELGFKALATIDTFEILPFKILHFVISFVIISKLVKPLRELYGTENSER